MSRLYQVCKKDDSTEVPLVKPLQKEKSASSTVDDWDIIGDFGAVMEKADILQAFYDS